MDDLLSFSVPVLASFHRRHFAIFLPLGRAVFPLLFLPCPPCAEFSARAFPGTSIFFSGRVYIFSRDFFPSHDTLARVRCFLNAREPPLSCRKSIAPLWQRAASSCAESVRSRTSFHVELFSCPRRSAPSFLHYKALFFLSCQILMFLRKSPPLLSDGAFPAAVPIVIPCFALPLTRRTVTFPSPLLFFRLVLGLLMLHARTFDLSAMGKCRNTLSGAGDFPP